MAYHSESEALVESHVLRLVRLEVGRHLRGVHMLLPSGSFTYISRLPHV